jgi:uncharacterized protein YdhG (YjbR/CyaY superfamily)
MMFEADNVPTVDAYIAAQPAAVQPMLNEMRALVHRAAPQAAESISYDMPTYKLGDQRLVYFAAWKQHIGLYGLPAAVLDQFEADVDPYRQPKGTLQFPYSQPLPAELIENLLRANRKRLQVMEA